MYFMTKRAAFKTSIKNLKNFNNFVLGVSMGSENHTGEAFEATVECVNTSGLKQGIIDVSDTLKRYSYMADLTEIEARQKAEECGKKWVIENTESIKKFRIPVNVLHWDTWLNDKRFSQYFYQFQTAYETSPPLREAIEKDIADFNKRRSREFLQTKREHELSVSFHLEELTAASIQFEDNPAAAQLYAGKELNCFKCVRSGQIPNIPKGIQNAQFFRINVYNVPANDVAESSLG